MRVLLVSNLFPPDIGGPATYVSRLALEFHRRSHSVRLVVCSEDLSRPLDYPFAVQRVSRRISMPLRMLLVLLEVVRQAREADVVYVNGLELPGVLGPRLLGKPAVLKVVGDFAWEYAVRHGWTDDGIDFFQTHRYGWKVEAVRRIQQWYARNVARVVTPSLYLKGVVAGWRVPPDRISVLHNALVSRFDHRITREDARAAVGLSGALVLCVARLYRWKKLDTLIRLAPRLPRGSKLVIVGDGPEEDSLRALAVGLGLADRVVFAGRVPQERVSLYMRACDVFVLNTRYEGLSHTLLEAMDVGIPIVATAVGGNLELIENGVNGFLVEVDDSEAILTSVRRLLEDQELRETFVSRSKESVRDSSWDRLVDMTEAVLAQVATGRES